MKIQIIVLLLPILAGVGSAGAYSLADYNVSFNISVPSTAVHIAPTYDSQTRSWNYQLNVLPENDSIADSNDSWQIAIGIDEYATPREANVLENYAVHRKNDKLASGVQGYKNVIVEYNGYAANIESFPYQSVRGPGGMLSIFPETYQLCYMRDDKTAITVSSIGAGKELFTQLIGTLQIKKYSMYKESFIGKTSDWAGAGNGSIHGGNAFSVLGDPAEEVPNTPFGVGR